MGEGVRRRRRINGGGRRGKGESKGGWIKKGEGSDVGGGENCIFLHSSWIGSKLLKLFSIFLYEVSLWDYEPIY